MARVIKAGQGAPKPRPQSAPIGPGKKKVIEKEVYKARQEAADILAEAEQEQQQILQEGQQRAHQAHEEAMLEAAEEAFAEAAKEALAAFRARAERYDEAADDIRVLAFELAKKVLGNKVGLDDGQIDDVIREGMHDLRAKRTLRMQLPQERVDALQMERPRLMAALSREPDLMVIAAPDVSEGFCRVVIEPGAALCTEQEALDLLTDALNIEEQAVAPEPEAIQVPDAVDDEHGSFADDDDETRALPERPAPSPTGRGPATGVHALDGDGGSMIRPGTGRSMLPSGGTGVRALDAAKDSDSTMALDVSQLRSEFAADDESTGDGPPEE